MEFVAISNITEEKLKKLLELGLDGLIAPSVQIKELSITKDEQGFDRFGEISFLLKKENIFGNHKTIPEKEGTHFIFTADAYTVRFPELTYTVDIKRKNQLIKESINLNAPLYDNISYILDSNYKERYNSYEKLLKTNTMKMMYLKEYGELENFKIVYKKNKLNHLLKDQKEFMNIIKNMNYRDIRLNEDKYKEILLEIAKKDDKLGDFSKNFITKDGVVDTRDFFSCFTKDKEILNKKEIKPEMDSEKTYENLTKLMKKILKEKNVKYEDFVYDKIRDIYKDPKIADNKQYVCEKNILNYMRKNSGRSKEETDSERKIVASLSKRIRSIDDMIHYADKLEFSENQSIKEQEIRKKHINISITANIDIDFWIKYANSSKEQIQKALKCENTEKIAQDIVNLLGEYKLLKVPYFEAKPMKVLYFKHFKALKDEQLYGVVLPKDVSEEIKRYMERSDLNVYYYDRNKPEQRDKIIRKIEDIRIKEEEKLTKKIKPKF